MKRRQFLRTATTAGAIACMPVAVQAASRDAVAANFRLVRADTGQAGARFVDLACAGATCGAARLRVRIDGLHPADGAPVLQELWLNAQFGQADGSTALFSAWQFSRGPRPHMAQRIAFVVARDRLRGFRLDYRTGGHQACAHESCAMNAFSLPLLTPGQYVLLGPRRDGRPAPTRGLRASGDATAPLQWNGTRDFDYVALRIEALG